MKKTWKIIRTVLYIFIVLFLLSIIIMQVLPVDKSLQYFGFRPLVVVSPSMSGELDVLDMVVIKRVNIDNLKPGDIVTFIPPEESLEANGFIKGDLFTHYIASIEKKGEGWEIHTKSNVSQQWDNWVLTEKNLVGEKWFSIPKAGYVIFAFQNPIVVRNFIVIVIIIIAAIWIWPWKKKKEPAETEPAISLEGELESSSEAVSSEGPFNGSLPTDEGFPEAEPFDDNRINQGK